MQSPPPPHEPSRGAPPPDSAPSSGLPSGRRGAARADGVVRMEDVRITKPDLDRRLATAKTRHRLKLAMFGFASLFGALGVQLTLATVVRPRLPPPAPPIITQITPPAVPGTPGSGSDSLSNFAQTPIPGHRATIVDRNGQPLAISLPSVALFADPRQIIDPDEAVRKLKQVLPRMDAVAVRRRFEDTSLRFAYVEHQITPREELAVNALGIPGVDFEPTEVRRYPMGPTVSQVLGSVDFKNHGAAGVEKSFDKRLLTDPSPLRLSIDVRVQAVMREELSKAMTEFKAIGACGIVLDVRTGEVIAMVSLPDYDPNNFATSTDDQQFNRAISGLYEPGSTFKLQTASMALDDGIVHIWDQFDASRPIHVGRFTITDFEGKHRWLYLPEVLAYSSNLGAAHIALDVGAERQRAWLEHMGMFAPTPIQLPGAARPQFQSAASWRETTVMTVGFGHGISIEPLQLVRGTAGVATGYLVDPTIVALPADAQPPRVPVMKVSTNEIMRKMMRLVVTSGYGKPADVPGYYVGGKTGTAEKVGAHGYRKHTNVSAFVSVFPMNAPRYAVYFMLDEPHGNKSTGGYSTAGAVSAPGAGRVIARIAPMLGMLPDMQDADQINAALAIPLQPAPPPGAPKLIAVDSGTSGEPRPGQAAVTPVPASTRRVAPLHGDARHEAALPAPRLLPVSTKLASGVPSGAPR